jgi:hypothetical protein
LKLREVERETAAAFLFFLFSFLFFLVESKNREKGEFERKLFFFSVVTERQREEARTAAD